MHMFARVAQQWRVGLKVGNCYICKDDRDVLVEMKQLLDERDMEEFGRLFV